MILYPFFQESGLILKDTTNRDAIAFLVLWLPPQTATKENVVEDGFNRIYQIVFDIHNYD
jgi:hypothetical protein